MLEHGELGGERRCDDEEGQAAERRPAEDLVEADDGEHDAERRRDDVEGDHADVDERVEVGRHEVIDFASRVQASRRVVVFLLGLAFCAALAGVRVLAELDAES